MRRRTLMFATCAVAFAIPVAGASAVNGHAKAAAAKQCAADKKADKGAFKAIHGKHAMRSCIKGTARSLNGEARNAAQECKAERAADPASFAMTYGSNSPRGANANGGGKNALGKCVSSKVREEIVANVEAFESAADICREQRRGDAETFMDTWGTNAPRGEKSRGAKRNAFGKCVSATAKTLQQGPAA